MKARRQASESPKTYPSSANQDGEEERPTRMTGHKVECLQASKNGAPHVGKMSVCKQSLVCAESSSFLRRDFRLHNSSTSLHQYKYYPLMASNP